MRDEFLGRRIPKTHMEIMDSVCKDFKTKLKGCQNQHYYERDYLNNFERVCDIHFATHFCQRRPIQLNYANGCKSILFF